MSKYVINRREEIERCINGQYFTASCYDDNVDTGTPYYVAIKTGAKTVYISNSLSCFGQTKIEFYEGATTSAGSSKTVFNRNRNSAVASLTTYTEGVTVSAEGTLIAELLVPGASGNQKTGSGAKENVIWILKPNTEYLIKLIAKSNNTVINLTTEFEEV